MVSRGTSCRRPPGRSRRPERVPPLAPHRRCNDQSASSWVLLCEFHGYRTTRERAGAKPPFRLVIPIARRGKGEAAKNEPPLTLFEGGGLFGVRFTVSSNSVAFLPLGVTETFQ